MDSRILGLAFFWEMVGAVGTKRGIATESIGDYGCAERE